jgi:hypothetical protein
LSSSSSSSLSSSSSRARYAPRSNGAS